MGRRCTLALIELGAVYQVPIYVASSFSDRAPEPLSIRSLTVGKWKIE